MNDRSGYLPPSGIYRMNVRIATTSGRITIEGRDEIKVSGCQSGDLMTLIGQIHAITNRDEQ